jgi:exodeoxyribonuclease VII large subunit
MQQRLTVSEATSFIKACIDEGVPPLWVEGEISNFVAHTSGHFYFSLKDARAQLRCVMFRGANARLRFHPCDGSNCAALGRVTVYPRNGQYQLIVERLLPLGAGELQAAFEALKQRLETEGLYDAARKRRLPTYPESIGVVTSRTGAAIRDIVKILRRRWPPIRIVLRPTQVQGEGAARSIVEAIEAFNRSGDVDLLIVGRGGGSLEDLWAFNEEVVARAIAASEIPVISAVGHETDTTIADFVADLRAPTPSAAAELAVRDFREVLSSARVALDRCARALMRAIESLRLRVDALGRSYALRSPLDRLLQETQRADDLLRRAAQGLAATLTRTRDRIGYLEGRIEALSPSGVLQRGYAMALDHEGLLIRSVMDVESGDSLRVELRDGVLSCRVEKRVKRKA